MVLYYFGQVFETYSIFSVAMLTLSLAMASLVIPYIKSWSGKIALKKLELEKKKKKLPVEKIVEEYNDLELEKETIDNTKILVFINIGLFFGIMILSTLVQISGSYNCLKVEGCLQQNTPLWSINAANTLLGISMKNIVDQILPLGSFFGIIFTIIIIFRIYSIINKLIIEEAKIIK